MIRSCLCIARIFFLALLLSAGAAHADTYRVGRGGTAGGCTHDSLQDAIDKAQQNGGPDTITLDQGMTNSVQALRIEAQDLTIIGGYTDCSRPNGPIHTTVSGDGGEGASVFTIRGPGTVRLEKLDIMLGDAPGDGGGISFEGRDPIGSGAKGGLTNVLQLVDTIVSNNHAAGNGGGISFRSAATAPARLELGENSDVRFNIAGADGGGIAIAGRAQVVALARRVFVRSNEAHRNGGGLAVFAPAGIDIGSISFPTHAVATISDNHARQDGGGIYALDAPDNDDGSTVLRLYGLDPAQALALQGNTAARYGGAIGATGRAGAALRICTRGINLRDNQARSGGALSLTHAHYGHCPDIEFPPIALCSTAVPCNRIDGNLSQNVIGSSMFRLYGASIDLHETTIIGNAMGSSLFISEPQDGVGSRIALRNALLADNVIEQIVGDFFRIGTLAEVDLTHTTIAGNPDENGAKSVFFAPSHTPGPRSLRVRNSIVHQPGAAPFVVSDTTTTLDHVLLDFIPAEHAGNPTLIAADPQFVSSDDLRLQPSSPAVDYAPEAGAPTVDIDAHPRPIDLATRDDLFGPVDLGAFEVQADPIDSLFFDGFEQESTTPADASSESWR